MPGARRSGGCIVHPRPSAQPPALDNGQFVTAAYIAVLNRLPDATGWIYWKGVLGQGVPRVAVTDTFLNPNGEYAGVCPGALPVGSPTNGAFITCLYNHALGRNPDPDALTNGINALNAGYSRAALTDDTIASWEFHVVNGVDPNRLAYNASWVGMNEDLPIPNPTVNIPQQYTFHFKNSAYGVTDVMGGQIVFSSNPNAVTSYQGCQIEWRYWGELYLAGPYGISSDSQFGQNGSLGPLSGTVCSLNTGSSTKSPSSDGLGYDVRFWVTFTTPGPYKIWANGADSQWEWGTWVSPGTTNVAASGGTFTVSAPTVQVPRGQARNVAETIFPANGFNSPVTFALTSNPPAGLTATFSPPTAMAPGTNIAVSAASNTPAGTYYVPFRGVSGSLTQNSTLTVLVPASTVSNSLAELQTCLNDANQPACPLAAMTYPVTSTIRIARYGVTLSGGNTATDHTQTRLVRDRGFSGPLIEVAVQRADGTTKTLTETGLAGIVIQDLTVCGAGNNSPTTVTNPLRAIMSPPGSVSLSYPCADHNLYPPAVGCDYTNICVDLNVASIDSGSYRSNPFDNIFSDHRGKWRAPAQR